MVLGKHRSQFCRQPCEKSAKVLQTAYTLSMLAWRREAEAIITKDHHILSSSQFAHLTSPLMRKSLIVSLSAHDLLELYTSVVILYSVDDNTKELHAFHPRATYTLVSSSVKVQGFGRKQVTQVSTTVCYRIGERLWGLEVESNDCAQSGMCKRPRSQS